MAWIFIAITSHFCWALVNVGDKYLISNRIKNPYVYFSWLVFGMSIMFFLIPFIQYYFPPFYLLKWIILGSIASFLGALLYFKSITIEEISRINMWWNMIPLFSFLIAWITLGEILTLNQGIAFIILMFGAILASIHIQKTRVLFSRALLLMTLACFLFAVQAVTTHHVTQEIPFTHVFITNIMFMILLSCSLFLSTSFRRDFRTEIKKINISLGTAVLSISILDGLGYFFNACALSHQYYIHLLPVQQ